MGVSRSSSLLLSVFEGCQDAGTGTEIFKGGQPKAHVAANTVRVGEQLHVGLAVAQVPESELPLVPGVNYSYNLSCACLEPRSWAGATQVSDEIGPQMDPAMGLYNSAETNETATFAAVSRGRGDWI